MNDHEARETIAELKYIGQHLIILDRRLDRIEAMLRTLQRSEAAMTQQMNDLIQEVKNTVDVEQSAILALEGIETQLAQAIADLRNSGADTAAIQGLKDSLSTKRAELAHAIANVPAPTPTPVPNVPPTPAPETPPAPPAPAPAPEPTPEPTPEPPTP